MIASNKNAEPIVPWWEWVNRQVLNSRRENHRRQCDGDSLIGRLAQRLKAASCRPEEHGFESRTGRDKRSSGWASDRCRPRVMGKPSHDGGGGVRAAWESVNLPVWVRNPSVALKKQLQPRSVTEKHCPTKAKMLVRIESGSGE